LTFCGPRWFDATVVLRDTGRQIGRRAGRVLSKVARRLDPPAPVAKTTWVAPGHFYSPLPKWEELAPRADVLFDQSPPSLLDVDLAPETQRGFLAAFEPYRADRLYRGEDARDVRYHSSNNMFGQKSANALHLMLRVLRPRRIVEVGSGFSSAVMLDTREHFDADYDLTFVEPYPDRLRGLLRASDACAIVEKPLELAPRAPFEALEDGDILFVDSSHVIKTGNDLCALFFEILPALAAGVYVHFHDVLYPFEYPLRWVEEGRAWNEAYVLRAFLANNAVWSLQFWASYLYRCHRDWIDAVPEVSADGSSIWIRKAGGASSPH
jgi:predicted O-methyltransferase YrrM